MSDRITPKVPYLPTKSSQPGQYTRREALRYGTFGAAGLILAACGDNGVATTTAAPATTAGVQLGGTLSMLFDYGYAGLPGTMGEFFREAGRRFSEQTGVNFDGTEVALADLTPRITASHAAREGPALQTFYTNYSSYEFLNQEVAEPLDSWVPGGQEEIDHWLFRGQTFNGQTYNCPILSEIFMMAVNRSIFEAAGVELPVRWASWDSMIEAFRTVKANGDVPVMAGSADGFNSEKWVMASEMAHQNEHTDITKWGLGEYTIDDPIASSWIDNIDQLLTEELLNPDVADLTEQQALERFISGEGAAMLLYPGAVFALADDTYDVVGLWQGDGAISAPISVGGSGIIMATYGENKEAAGEFLAFLHAPEQSKLFNETTSELPPDDRFDPSGLPPLARQTWDLVTSDPPPYWIHDWMHYDITFSIIYPISQKAFAGVSTAEELKAEYDGEVSLWRENNPEGMALQQGFFDAVTA